MLFLCDFIPTVCPNCGRGLLSSSQVADFLAGEGHTCFCGTRFRYVDRDTLAGVVWHSRLAKHDQDPPTGDHA